MKASVLLLITISSCAAYEVALYGGCINRSLNGQPDSDGNPHFHCHFDSTYCQQGEEWLDHNQLVAEDLGPCSCDYEYKTNVYMSSCYDVRNTHRLRCAAEDEQCPTNWSKLGPRFNSEDLVTDDCGHLSEAYGAFQGASCGKRCSCMFTYTSGTEILEGMSTRYGSCHGGSGDPYCAIKASSCAADETFYGVWESESEDLDCDCSETLTGACVTTADAVFLHCAVSADSCGTQSFVPARDLRDSTTLTNECRLCSGILATSAPSQSESPTGTPTPKPTGTPTKSNPPTLSQLPTPEPDAPIEAAVYGGCINRALNGQPDSDGKPHFHCHFDGTSCGSDEEWLNHYQVTDEMLGPCTCDREYKKNVYTHACYDVKVTHQLVCAADGGQCPNNWSDLGYRYNSDDSVSDDCGHMSDAYGAFEGNSCGKRCGCAFTYTSGSKKVEAGSTRYGSCHNDADSSSYCALKATSCASGERFVGAWEPESVSLDCSCDKTLVGACVTQGREFQHCAVAPDSCDSGSVFVGIRELALSSDLKNNCRLCRDNWSPTPSPTGTPTGSPTEIQTLSPTASPTTASSEAPSLSVSPSVSIAPSMKPSTSTSPTEPTTLSPTDTCLDDPSFRLSGRSYKDCRWVQYNENRRQNACDKYPNLQTRCPVACGVCCADNPDFRFISLFGYNSCAWLDSAIKKVASCNNRRVQYNCPIACDTCHSYVPHVPR